MTSNGNGELDADQLRALNAARNAQKAVIAVHEARLQSLYDRRDSAFAKALAVGVPAGILADETGLTPGRVSQMRAKFRRDGVLS